MNNDIKISENELVSQYKNFLITKNLVNEKNSHFGGDNDLKGDIEINISNKNLFKGITEDYIIIEAKSHHSKDSANTINKIFGQLLKETGKKNRNDNLKNYCLALLIPEESSRWKDSKDKSHSRPKGDHYYRQGFKRIDRKAYIEFGTLVNAKYIFVFSRSNQFLSIYTWEGFYDKDNPIVNIS